MNMESIYNHVSWWYTLQNATINLLNAAMPGSVFVSCTPCIIDLSNNRHIIVERLLEIIMFASWKKEWEEDASEGHGD